MRMPGAIVLLLVAAPSCASGASDRVPSVSAAEQAVSRKAMLDALNARLLASNSATEVLRGWCAEHRLADPPRIVARLVAAPPKPITAAQRQRLRIGETEPVRYRRVELMCGAHVLSEADNWYVPARLTPAMNRLLETSDTPFGRVIAPLRPTRRNLAARALWSPAVTADDQPGRAMPRLPLPYHLLKHHALVIDAHGAPLAEVIETYTSAVVGNDLGVQPLR